MPQRNLVWLLAAALISLFCYTEAERSRFGEALAKTYSRITASYVEPLDERALFEGAMNGMFETLDGYSGYISEDDLAQFNAEIGQHFGGIGIEVALQQDRITVLNPVPGAPAHQAGMLSGDVIVSIDGQNVESADLMKAVKLMRGEVGTEVRVEVRRGQDERKEFLLTRADIRIDSVRGDVRDERGVWSYVLTDHPRIGYIRLSSFGDESAAELREAIRQMLAAGGKGLILDLRGNAGGLLSAAVDICDMFLPPGREIVSTRGRDGRIQDQFFSQQPPFLLTEIPVVVLVDRFSASASEIVAACLQDHGRATIVGEQTWGKGTVQNVIPVGPGSGAMRLTTQSYWRPSGRNIHKTSDSTADDSWGVSPRGPNQVEFSQDEYEAVQKQRQQRDRLGAPPLDDADRVKDRQFERAVEVMLRELS